jgi:hypothetical protein
MLSVLVALPLTIKPPYQGSGSAVSPTSPKNIGQETGEAMPALTPKERKLHLFSLLVTVRFSSRR